MFPLVLDLERPKMLCDVEIRIVTTCGFSGNSKDRHNPWSAGGLIYTDVHLVESAQVDPWSVHSTKYKLKLTG